MARGLVSRLDFSAEVPHGVPQLLKVTKPLGCLGSAEAVEGEILCSSTGGNAGIDSFSGCIEIVNPVAVPLIAGQVGGEPPVIELSRSRK